MGSQEFLDPTSNDYLSLKRALMNEKASPEVLMFESDLVSRIYSRIEQQEAVLEDSHGGVVDHSSASSREAYKESKELASTCISIELSRIKYMLRSYLRVRLFKIENYVMHCIESEEVQDRLSPLERSYAYDYVRLVGTHLKTHVTSKFPEAFSSVTKQASAHSKSDMVPVPDVGHHVFARVERDLGEIEFYDDGTTSELQAGDLYILRYKVVRQFLQEGSVVLV
jgi:GINS complex subunit 4